MNGIAWAGVGFMAGVIAGGGWVIWRLKIFVEAFGRKIEKALNEINGD